MGASGARRSRRFSVQNKGGPELFWRLPLSPLMRARSRLGFNLAGFQPSDSACCRRSGSSIRRAWNSQTPWAWPPAADCQSAKRQITNRRYNCWPQEQCQDAPFSPTLCVPPMPPRLRVDSRSTFVSGQRGHSELARLFPHVPSCIRSARARRISKYFFLASPVRKLFCTQSSHTGMFSVNRDRLSFKTASLMRKRSRAK